MPDILSIPFFFLLGLILLVKGGDMLVDGAKTLALRVGLSPMVVGLTVVGFGTSAPELLVSMQAALQGSPALALGNVLGSNVANVLLILAVGAIVAGSVALPLRPMARDFGFFVGSGALVWLLMADGQLGRLDGLLLVAGLGAFLWMSLRAGKSAPLEGDALVALPTLWFSIGMVVVGLIGLVLGARWLVDSSSAIARGIGISEAVIGLTVLAVGTSLPELSATIAAARKREMGMAVGNVVGSNIFNIFSILGLVALIAPIPVDARFVGVDAPLALGVSVLVVVVSALVGRLNARVGWAMIGLYAVYTITMLVG